jgi:hypothetical protein
MIVSRLDEPALLRLIEFADEGPTTA